MNLYFVLQKFYFFFVKSCKINQFLNGLKFFTEYCHSFFNNISCFHWSNRLYCKYKSIFNLSNFDIILQSFHTNRLSFLGALSTKNTFLWGNYFQYSIVYLEDLGRARISYGLFLCSCGLCLMIHFNIGIGLESSKLNWRPFGVHLSSTLLDLKPDVYLLASVKFDDRNSNLFIFIKCRFKFDRHYSIFLWLIHHIYRLYIKWGNFFPSFSKFIYIIVIFVVNLEPKLKFTCLTVINTFLSAIAFPRKFILINILATKRDKTNSLSEELIMQDRCIIIYTNEMRRHRGYFCN